VASAGSSASGCAPGLICAAAPTSGNGKTIGNGVDIASSNNGHHLAAGDTNATNGTNGINGHVTISSENNAQVRRMFTSLTYTYSCVRTLSLLLYIYKLVMRWDIKLQDLCGFGSI